MKNKGFLVALWCLAGFWLASHHKITQMIERRGQRIVPAVFILIGLYIFQKETSSHGRHCGHGCTGNWERDQRLTFGAGRRQ